MSRMSFATHRIKPRRWRVNSNTRPTIKMYVIMSFLELQE